MILIFLGAVSKLKNIEDPQISTPTPYFFLFVEIQTDFLRLLRNYAQLNSTKVDIFRIHAWSGLLDRCRIYSYIYYFKVRTWIQRYYSLEITSRMMTKSMATFNHNYENNS